MAIETTSIEPDAKTNTVITHSTPDYEKNAVVYIVSSGSPAKENSKSGSYLRTFIIVVLLVSVLLLSLGVFVLITKYSSNSPETVKIPDINGKNPIANSSSPPDLAKVTSRSTPKVISRSEWMAQPPLEELSNLSTPVPYVIIMHTGTANCSSRAQCAYDVRYIQTFHIESNGWWDIGYNFLVGGDGDAYEGRGWTTEGAHTYGYNAKSIGIAFIGTFTKYKPPEIQMTACKQLIEKGVELGYVNKEYKLLAARQLQTTASPGEVLYEEIQTWPHWSPSP